MDIIHQILHKKIYGHHTSNLVAMFEALHY